MANSRTIAPKSAKSRPGDVACSLCKKRDCRPGRPLCRRPDRVKRSHTCYCNSYHYPHRSGSGRCLDNPKGADRMNELCYGVAS